MNIWLRIGLYTIGLLLLGLWICACAAGFWYLLKATPEGISDNYVSSLAWPFVAVMVTIPAITVILIGGLRMLGQVLSLKGFLTDLPGHVSSLEKLTAQMEEKKRQFEALKSAIEEAAGTIDLTGSQLADFQASLERLREANGNQPDADNPRGNLVERLTDHLTDAKAIFDAAASRYQDQHGEEIERARGWILETSVRDLKDYGNLSPEAAIYVTTAIDIDRKTRRAGRKNLEQVDIDRLDALKPA